VVDPTQVEGKAADVTRRWEQSLPAVGRETAPPEHPDGLHPDDEPLGSTPVLDQDEIDSLLGFDTGADHNASGIQGSSTTPSSPTSVCRCSRWCSIDWSG
jgi:hypothetical protein